MSTTVSYKGSTIATAENATKTLLTEGKYLEDDITIVDVTSGGGSTLITKNISANGTYNASSDSADGYSSVTVAVPASAVDSGTKNITANGNGQDVIGYAAVNVNVPNTYSAGDEGKVVSSGALVSQTAHADVTPTASDQTIDTTTNNSIKVKGDADLVAGNIKKDVEIFGVTGSYEGGGGGLSLVDVLQGEEPSGSVSFKATENLAARAVSGRKNITDLTIDFSDGYNIRAYRAISENIALQRVVLLYNDTTEHQLSLYDYGISDNSALTSIIIRGKFYYTEQSGFRNNTNLELVDLETSRDGAAAFGNNCFYNESKLKTVILRKSTVVPINASSFTGSGLASSGATVYVPSSLITSYQSASNWSTLYNNGYVTFSALENSVYANIDWYKS